MIELRFDISKFNKSWNNVSNNVKLAIIHGFAKTAERGRNNVRNRTRAVFKLHSDYIPNAVLSIPTYNLRSSKKMSGFDRGQLQFQAALKGLKGKHKNFQAAVFLRGSANPTKSLDFMVVHETGGTKESFKGKLAIPRYGVTRKKFRTSTGRVKKSYKPGILLKTWNKVRGQQSKKLKKKGVRLKPTAFILESKFGGFVIARRRTRSTWLDSKNRAPLDILYKFSPSAKINKRWNFVQTVHTTVNRHVFKYVNREISKV